MAVFQVVATDTRSGSSNSRPVVADDAEQARVIAEVEWGIAEEDPDVQWDVQQKPDPAGITERMLLDAERRRLENEYFAFPKRNPRSRLLMRGRR